MDIVTNFLTCSSRSKADCAAYRESIQPLKQAIDEIDSEQEASMFDDQAHEISYQEELDLIKGFTQITLAITNCAESILEYIETAIQQEQDSSKQGQLVVAFANQVGKISMNFFHLSKGFHYESCAGLFVPFTSVVRRLLGMSMPGDLGLPEDFDHEEFYDLDKGLKEALDPLARIFRPENDNAQSMFQNLIHSFLLFDNDQFYKQEASQLDAKHLKFIEFAELISKKLAQLWCDFSINFAKLYIKKFDSPQLGFFPDTLSKIADIAGYQIPANKQDPMSELQSLRQHALEQTQHISSSDLDDFDWKLNDESIAYLLSKNPN